MTTSPTTIVCCIEHGRLERQTVLMLRSLRRFGGKLANVPVLVVVGRRGARLHRATLSALDELGVDLVRAPAGDNPFPWFNYANKVAAVTVAERTAETQAIAWVDSDVLVAGEPRGLALSPDEDFAARCEHLPPAVHRGDQTNEPYWRALCSLLGTTYDELPWIDCEEGRPPQRMFFNSGIFVWRRGSGFAQAYAAGFEQVLRSRLAQANGSFFAADQVILSPIVIRDRLRWRHMTRQEHFMIFPGFIEGEYRVPSLEGASMLHYGSGGASADSGALSPPHRPALFRRLRAELPHLADWLNEQGSDVDRNATPWSDRVTYASLKLWRAIKWRLYAKRVKRCA